MLAMDDQILNIVAKIVAKDRRKIPLLMADWDVNGGPCLRKEIQLSLSAHQRNCNWPGQNVAPQKFSLLGMKNSRPFSKNITCSINHIASGMLTKLVSHCVRL